jgi:hypothetical protein
MDEHITTPVTAEDLTSPAVVGPAHAAVYEVIRTWPGSAERNAVIWRAVEAYQTALATVPGDLPARMAEAFRAAAHFCDGRCDCQPGEHDTVVTGIDGDARITRVEGTPEGLARVTVGVRDEHLAATLARLAHALGELSSLRDHRARWETEKARADQLGLERDEWRDRVKDLDSERIAAEQRANRAESESQQWRALAEDEATEAQVERLQAELADMRNQRDAAAKIGADNYRELVDVAVERDALKAKVTEYENALNWQVSCLGCSKSLTASINDQAQIDLLTEERDALKDGNERARTVASGWKVEARKASSRVAEAEKYVEEIRWNAWAAAYGCHADELLAALDAPETTDSSKDPAGSVGTGEGGSKSGCAPETPGDAETEDRP